MIRSDCNADSKVTIMIGSKYLYSHFSAPDLILIILISQQNNTKVDPNQCIIAKMSLVM